MAENMNYRCLNCGGELTWNPGLQAWKCEYCDSEFQLKELEAAQKAKVQEESAEHRKDSEEKTATDGTARAAADHLVEYSCSYCGARIITDETTSATFCAYCQSPIVISSQLAGDFAPEKLIPFVKTKETVMKEYQSFVKKPLTPRFFYEQNNIEKLTGIYIPFFLYDTKGMGNLDVKGTRVTVWQDSRNRYTKTDTYSYKVEGNLEFENIPVDASSKTDDAAMDSIEPFDFNKMVDFSPAYLAGFMAERYDEEDERTRKRMEHRANKSLKNQLLQTAPAYNTTSVVREDLKQIVAKRKYVLLPTWILNTRYHGKDYLFAMNGQTGKFVGNLPVDKKKLCLYGLGTFAGGFVVFWLITRWIIGF
ncbi:hypothetical protein [Novisyntrophococcus fermenticellae]|uniref:hypothetical protein n=1 Tax=Novisyntrophococcus fermenticellae TaxID=2068655 RepID=UPI001E30127E|nr:hypothetical protein [Novisyntrophococcus fermenticellae]